MPAAKVSPGAKPHSESDDVPELLEVGDEPSGLAFRVAFGEVVAAWVAVDLAGGEDV